MAGFSSASDVRRVTQAGVRHAVAVEEERDLWTMVSESIETIEKAGIFQRSPGYDGSRRSRCSGGACDRNNGGPGI
jgi:hypothetical protein